jgi:metallo-beta-lactamase family protein
MQIQFIGATGTVTGSKYLLTEGKRHFLVDCGLFQGLKVLRLRNWNPLPIKPKAIEAVILTHAHIDHTGYLPLLVKNGFRGSVYATAGTRALCRILLPDSGHLQEEDADFMNRHHLSKHHPALPLYTEEDAVESLDYFETVPWGKKIGLSKHLSFQFLPAGHILGAGVVQFTAAGRRITFSGDLGRPNGLIMKAPTAVPETDYLVVESTYGDRLHSKEDPKETLMGLVQKTIDRGGIVLIPAFAVGRAQEVLHLVSELKREGRVPDIPVYLNSPMAADATRIFCDFPGDHALTEEECEAMCEVAKFVTTVEESKRLNTSREPAIIISASGMLTGGRVLHHLKFLLPNPKNLVLFVGFQAAGTRGEAMLDGADEVKIHGEMIPVRAEVRLIDTLSAHADSDEIIAWLKNFSRPPKMTFITHGEPLASEALRKRIDEELHWPCEVPDYLETFELK